MVNSMGLVRLHQMSRLPPITPAGYLLQTTESWPLVFGVTAAHYVLGAAIWSAWCGEAPVPEDRL